MPRRPKGPRLWLRPARRDAAGRVTHPAVYLILDQGGQVSTGSAAIAQAEQALAAHIAAKHGSSGRLRDTAQIPLVDVLDRYVADIVPKLSDPKAASFRIERLYDFFGRRMLADVNGALCREYARASSTDAMARRDLEDLRSAISHHRKEGLHDRLVSVVLPERRPARERWLDRSEAARLLWTAWRRPKCRHVAKFVLIALYTGRRASVVCKASFRRETGRPYVDLATGLLWPPERARITRKRNPPIPLSDKLLTHLRAWHRGGQRYVVEWSGRAVTRVDKTMKDIAREAGLGEEVTPHVLRHTAATWQMQAGVDILEAGRYLGMTARTLESTYAHHRPEHLSAARDMHIRATRQRLPKDGRTRGVQRKNATARKTTI